MSKLFSNLKSNSKLGKKDARVGRGYGSGSGGHTSGKGNKGQKARSGGKVKLWFEGGQTPLIRRLPYKRGFRNSNSSKVKHFNLGEINEVFNDSTSLTVNEKRLIEAGYLEAKTYDFVKILSKGKIDKKYKFEGFIYSEKAKAKIVAAGGEAL